MRQVTRNLLGQITEIRGPNREHQRFIYSRAGQVRFRKIRPKPPPGKFCIIHDDPFGRRLETGVLTMAWDEEALRPLADNPAWPRTDASPPAPPPSSALCRCQDHRL